MHSASDDGPPRAIRGAMFGLVIVAAIWLAMVLAGRAILTAIGIA